MADKRERPRCNEEGPGHGDLCVLRPGHVGDHHHQPKNMAKHAARTWPQKPSLAKGVPVPGIPGQKDQRTSTTDGKEDQRTKRDE